MSEESKKEIANGIGIAAEKALDFLEKIIGGPIMEGTGILTDKIQYIRFKNKVDRTLKAIEFLKTKGIKTPKKTTLSHQVCKLKNYRIRFFDTFPSSV